METINPVFSNKNKEEEEENLVQEQLEDQDPEEVDEEEDEEVQEEEDEENEENEEDEEDEEDEEEDEDDEIIEEGEQEEGDGGQGEEKIELEEEENQTQKKIKYKAPKKVSTLSSSNYSYNVDDELFVEEQNFEKIDDSIKKSYIDSYHPECIHKNYDEMFKLTFIKRNKNVIEDPLHKTIPFLTKYEKTKIIGLRVKQLNSGAEPFINLEETFNSKVVLDNYLIAEKELYMKKLPFIISRPITNKHNEYWNLKDLEII